DNLDVVNDTIRTLKREISALRAALDSIGNEAPAAALDAGEVALATAAYVWNLKEVLAKGTVQERRSFVEYFVSSATLQSAPLAPGYLTFSAFYKKTGAFQSVNVALTQGATAQAVLHQGAVPVFADIDPKTYNLDPAQVEARVTSRTRAILAVHLHGLPAEMDAINALAERDGIPVIEDAAQAHGARYRGRPVGTLALIAAFSLNSTKNLPAGEGGLFVTASEECYARAARARFNGLDPDMVYDPVRPLDGEADSLATTHGWMYLPGELTSALARSQLERLAATTERSQANAARLTARLAELPGVEPPFVAPDRTHVFHKYRVRLDPARAGVGWAPGLLRDRVLSALRAEGVEVVLWQTAPLPAHPLFASREPYPEAAAALEASLVVGSQSYPLFAQPVRVVDAWADAFEKVWAHLPELSPRGVSRDD
ncbi:MAG: DegT/DnrJ/EryC1/StrS family aminotransferase, partial [Candidatus Eisenbacteria bacterium]